MGVTSIERKSSILQSNVVLSIQLGWNPDPVSWRRSLVFVSCGNDRNKRCVWRMLLFVVCHLSGWKQHETARESGWEFIFVWRAASWTPRRRGPFLSCGWFLSSWSCSSSRLECRSGGSRGWLGPGTAEMAWVSWGRLSVCAGTLYSAASRLCWRSPPLPKFSPVQWSHPLGWRKDKISNDASCYLQQIAGLAVGSLLNCQV